MKIPGMTVRDSVYKWWALGVVVIGGFMSILDTSIVNVAVPKMMAVFGVGTDKAQWILTGYMLTMGVIQPATGYFCDKLGTKRMYLMSLAIFTFGSALCGAAWSNDSMITFRVIQAIGGGMIIPVSMSIVYKIFPPAERNMAMGLWGISAMVAPAIGPTLSGYLVEYWDWRWIFTINIPVGILGYIVAQLILRETELVKEVKFDAGGVVTSGIGLFCLLLALSKGVDEGWTSAYIVTLFYIAFASLTLFVIIELNHDNPLLDLTLFKNWNFTFSTIVLFIGTVGLYGGIFLVPLFMENLRGYTAMQTGMLMFPSAATSGLMMPIAAKLADKFGAKPVIIAGITLLGLSTVPFIYIDLNTGYSTIVFVMIIRGMGLGLFMMPVTVMGMNTVSMEQISRASSLNNAIRQISGSMGIAILTTVLQNRQIFHIERIAESFNWQSYGMNEMLVHAKKLFMLHGDSLLVAQRKSFMLLSGIAKKQSFVFSFDDAFFVLVGICLLGVIPAMVLKPVKGGSKGAMPILD